MILPFAGCRSLLLTRQSYHVVERGHTCCYCGSVTVRVRELRPGWPLSGMLVGDPPYPKWVEDRLVQQ